MKLHQMRYLSEAAARNFNFSEVARVIHTSQPVISRQIQLLEEELGFDVLVRRGKRIVGLSREGETVLAIARRMLKESDDLKRFAEERSKRGRGRLTVATTHFHARYTLLDPILKFRKLHPNVLLRLKQSDPTDIERLVNAEEADLGITAQAPSAHSEVISIPCQSVPRIVITPPRHPLLSASRLTLERIAAHPLIVYDEKYSGGWSVMQTFQAKGLQPKVVMTAMDADVIKAYVAAGLGVSVVQTAVYDRRRDSGLRAIDAAHLFKPLVIVMMVKPRLYLNQALLDFATTVMPGLDAEKIESAVRRQQSA
jgi:LysR family cys regulon transcriptional activator